MTTRSELDRKFIAAVERLGRALRVARQHIATNHKISLLQLQLLEQLAVSGTRRVGELASVLDVTQPTVSDALAVLQHKGIVGRERDTSDRRATVVSLTKTGITLAHQAAAELAPLLDATRVTNDDDQALALGVVLEEIRRLQTNGVITVNRSCLTCQHYRPAENVNPGHCQLLDEQLRPRDLRVDCPDHIAAEPLGRQDAGATTP